MPSIYKLFIESHFLSHNLVKKKDYGTISLFDWNGDLSKNWYVKYSFRHPETKKLVHDLNLKKETCPSRFPFFTKWSQSFNPYALNINPEYKR